MMRTAPCWSISTAMTIHSQLHVHVLDLRVEAERILALLNTDARMLPSGEGRLRERDGVFVDGDHAAFKVSSEAVSAAQVVGPNTVQQTKRRIVGQFKGLLVRGKGGDRQHGAEELVLEQKMGIF